ncbi:metal-dependent hydrolase [Alteribacter populi]|uniref:metal-dependent hydrolase n=1 Tax=Alteribacter populi TaxID=2011011 RepID=UPI000BBB5EDF|nr:metal-dependent hydrolase [Alteribacter populi]
MKLTRLGHSCFVVELNTGTRIMVDPFLDQNPACPKDFLKKDYLETIDVVLVTHGHFDHASGLAELKKRNPEVLVVAQYEFALKLMGDGYHVFPLNFGGTYRTEDFEVTMVNAVHTSTFGETHGKPQFVGLPCGYVLNPANGETVYISGDTNVMADMKIIQDIYHPSIAILSCAGQFVMGPKEAAYALSHLLDVKRVVPCHTFPKVEDAADPDMMENLLENFPVVENMIGQDEELKKLMSKRKDPEVIVMDFGETKRL